MIREPRPRKVNVIFSKEVFGNCKETMGWKSVNVCEYDVFFFAITFLLLRMKRAEFYKKKKKRRHGKMCERVDKGASEDRM